MIVVSLPPTKVGESAVLPDTDTWKVYDHLKYYCTKFFPLPFIRSRVQDGKAIVTEGHKYLRIARELNHPTIRSIIDSTTPQEDVQAFLKLSGATVLNVKDIEREGNVTIAHDWQVFFFAQPLSPFSKEVFTSLMESCFSPTTSSLLARLPHAQNPKVAYRFEDTCAELQAWTPVADEKWLLSFIEACRRFSETQAQIVSYQGEKFYPQE